MAIENVNLGWLKDGNGKKFAPKTLSAQAIYDNSISGLNSSTSQGAIDELKNLLDNFNVSDKLSLSGGTLTGPLVGTTITADVITANKVYGAIWNDYAEWFEKENVNDTFDFGDICSWNENGVVLSSPSDVKVVGVVSNTYGHILGGFPLADMEENSKHFVPIGLTGRVNVKVKGTVKVGDLIISAGNGIGKVDNNASIQQVVGKALESSNDENVKLITVLIK